MDQGPTIVNPPLEDPSDVDQFRGKMPVGVAMLLSCLPFIPWLIGAAMGYGFGSKIDLTPRQRLLYAFLGLVPPFIVGLAVTIRRRDDGSGKCLAPGAPTKLFLGVLAIVLVGLLLGAWVAGE